MFTKVHKTAHANLDKPVLVWDGDCGFCKYWVIKLKRHTNDKIDYKPYQEIAESFKDLEISVFKEASRLIEPTGYIYSGPDSLYRSLLYSGYTNFNFHKYYNNYDWFAWISDFGYNIIAKNRSSFFKVSKFLFGKKP